MSRSVTGPGDWEIVVVEFVAVSWQRSAKKIGSVAVADVCAIPLAKVPAYVGDSETFVTVCPAPSATTVKSHYQTHMLFTITTTNHSESV